MYHVPDGGFFTVVEDHVHPELPGCENVIGINLAGDMLGNRFCESSSNGEKISVERFLAIFSNLMNEHLQKDANSSVVFIPHIYKDLDLISRLIPMFEDRFRRKRITVAPYLHGAGAQEYIFDLYRKCDLIIGNRFHANVCAIGLLVPSIGIINYPQIEKLYSELEMMDRAVVINKDHFEEKLGELIIDSLSKKEKIREKYSIVRNELLKETNSFHELINQWLNL
jgi:polysaccharide pyruvyl transferase WcaK-like protein